jgi:hypothetical protein
MCWHWVEMGYGQDVKHLPLKYQEHNAILNSPDRQEKLNFNTMGKSQLLSKCILWILVTLSILRFRLSQTIILILSMMPKLTTINFVTTGSVHKPLVHSINYMSKETNNSYLKYLLLQCVLDRGQDSIVSTVPCYSLDAFGFKLRRRQEIFSSRHSPREAFEPTQSPRQWVPGFIPSSKVAGAWC